MKPIKVYYVRKDRVEFGNPVETSDVPGLFLSCDAALDDARKMSEDELNAHVSNGASGWKVIELHTNVGTDNEIIYGYRLTCGDDAYTDYFVGSTTLNLPENTEIVNQDKFFDELICCAAIRNKQFVEEQRNSTDLIDMMRLVLCSYQTASEKIEYLKQCNDELRKQLRNS